MEGVCKVLRIRCEWMTQLRRAIGVTDSHPDSIPAFRAWPSRGWGGQRLLQASPRLRPPRIRSDLQKADIMDLPDDGFYSRIPTLSNAELFDYISNYSRYKVKAVHAAIAELQSRGFILSDDELANIESFFQLKANQMRRPLSFSPGLFRLIACLVFGVGILISIGIYINARPPLPNPLGYDPLDTKRYRRELELYGGKSNIMATEVREWFAGLWQGKNLSYTIACITVVVSTMLWFIGSRNNSGPDKFGEPN
jgi:hypothetical protein